MRTLVIPVHTGIDVYDEIAEAKRSQRVKSHLVRNRKAIDIAYFSYEIAAPALDSLVPIGLLKSHKKSLIHAYEKPTSALKTLRDELFEAAIKSKCPFCQISTHSTLDHYLPKEKFPEFSVYPQNLVPACDECNRHKRSLIVDQDTAVRLFIHPYYDNVPDVNFITAKLKVKNKTLTVTFQPYHNRSLSLQQYTHIANHFKTLGLSDRFRKSSITELSDIRDWIKDLAGQGAMVLKGKLIEQAKVYSNVGHNYWRRILFETLANDEDFLSENYKYL